MLGYHFTADKLRDGRPIPPIGEWLVHDGPVVPCQSGLHASEHSFDALTYACGVKLHRVELDGDLVAHGEPGEQVDKYAGRRRRILATIDATDLLREFARWCALHVIDLWDAPDIVREWLTTGNDSLRAAAEAAAGATARATALDAARAAAWAAAGAAWVAAWSARDAAGDATWAAARAAGASAGDAAWAAARAAGASAGDAAWAAARAAQRDAFQELVVKAFAAAEAAGGER